MQETKAASFLLSQTSPVRPHFFQKRKSTVHIRADEIIRFPDGSIDVALGRKVHKGPWLAAFQQAPHQASVCDIAVHKLVSRLGCDCFQVAQISCVGEFVEVDNGSRLPLHPLQNEVRSYKTCSASDEDRMVHESESGCRRANLQL